MAVPSSVVSKGFVTIQRGRAKSTRRHIITVYMMPMTTDEDGFITDVPLKLQKSFTDPVGPR